LNLRDRLKQGLVDIDLSLDDTQIDRLLGYLALLGKWNKSYNLTAITDPEKMLYYHLLDSLVIHDRVLPGQSALDLGSGAGLPGVPLAIALPASNGHCSTAMARKRDFYNKHWRFALLIMPWL